MTAAVDVLTFTYNQKDFIEECIDGVLCQKTTFPVRYIIADDGSNDGTQAIISKYAAKYKNIIPLLQPKRSYFIGNLRAGFNALESEYLAMCEGDDYWIDSHKLQKQYDFLQLHQEYSMCFHPVLVRANSIGQGNYLFPNPMAHPFIIEKDATYTMEQLVKGNFIQDASVMFRWRFKDGIPDWFNLYALPGDWYWFLLHADVGKVGCIYDAMAVYRKHSKGMWSAYAGNREQLHMKYIEGEFATIHHFLTIFDEKYKQDFYKFHTYFLRVCINKYAAKAKSHDEFKKLFEKNISSKFSTWKDAFKYLTPEEKKILEFLHY